ncbi:hypothetical protein J4Q44_G00351010 [Coregonus suidteri]|uniref:Uncharacterized protein n=1 Tax=Coregonus suidteri TaxID=861788 RepID=A0AAN8KSM4_9TELE
MSLILSFQLIFHIVLCLYGSSSLVPDLFALYDHVGVGYTAQTDLRTGCFHLLLTLPYPIV